MESSCPAGLESVETLADGSRVRLRPIRADDAALEVAFVDALSPQSIHMRFQGGMRHLSATALARFTQIDYARDMALVAIDESGDAPREVGVCRYFRLADGVSCEFAIVLADDWQRRGLGLRMLSRLIAIARDHRLEVMVGQVLATNRRMLDMCARLGFESRAMPGDSQVREVVLRLGAAPAPAAS